MTKKVESVIPMILTFAILDSDSDSDSGTMDHTRTAPFSNTLELPLSE